MKIKPKYFIEKDTPLAYYSFLKVLIILWLIVAVARIFAFMGEGNVVGVVEVAILFVIELFATIGLYKQQWEGVVYLYCAYAYNILDVLVALVIYVYYGFVDAYILGETIGAIIGTLIWAIPTWVYFSKRRPLFTPYEGKTEAVSKATEKTYNNIVGEQSKNMEIEDKQTEIVLNYCNKCGYKLLDDSLYCSKCGAKIR